MKQIALAEFKKKSSACIRWVAETRQTLQVMRDGEVCVEVIPIPPAGSRTTRPKKRKQK